jgi:hypothetical protein
MPAPDSVLSLVERFREHRDEYLFAGYNEATLRREFLEPMFKALGWDVDNTKGYAEAYKEVVHEDAIKISGATKAPDYAFRLGGVRKFFVEAKKPSVDVKGDPSPAYQLRRYAWSAKLPLSILTDFHEFAVYDCTKKPDPTDTAATGRILYLTCEDYARQWEEIAELFSPEAIQKGAFDKHAASAKKKGTTTVDDAFLKEIETWRDLLAHNLALRNPGLTQRELNTAVQTTIDRIIFLRICEGRGIEEYGVLQGLVNGTCVYARMLGVFRAADERYNSGLFHFRSENDRPGEPDTLTPSLVIDDKALREILDALYYPKSPYEFSVLPADILGHVYEQFLGKVIRLTAGHRAVVEEKPEVKKAGGVYYTPTYIVDYIVKNTVGKLLEGMTPKEAGSLRILDPACGSGSFLLGAYQLLLDWHQAWYVANDPERWARGRRPRVFRGQDGEWRLTTAERKRVLLDCIYGVDIDPQAVEVTKLSLLLKVLEGEDAESIGKTLSLLRERALPDLGKNIQCGNSLIGSDFYDDHLIDALTEEERYRINAFDWDAAFPEIMKQGGFDVVIGNPPYIRIQALKEWAPIEVEYYKKAYVAASKGNYDIYVVFVERGLSLLSPCGRLGFILPHKFFNAQYGEPLRRLIAEGRHLAEVVDFGDQQVFARASTYTCLMFLQRAGASGCQIMKVDNLDAWRAEGKGTEGSIPAKSITAAEWNLVIGKGAALFERLAAMPVSLADVTSRTYQGPITSADTVYLFKKFKPGTKGTTEVVSAELGESTLIESAILKRVVRSGSIGRYSAMPTALVLFPYEVKDCEARLYTPKEMQDRFPLAWEYLNRNRDLLVGREKGKFRDAQWYRFGRTQNLGMWEQPKLMIPYMINELAAYLDREDDFYFINVTTGGYGITSNQEAGSLEYLCALLNSRLLDFYLKRVTTTFRGGYFAANRQFIELLPIRRVDLADRADEARHAQAVALVTGMLSLKKRLSDARTDHDKTVLRRQIDATDRKIDQLVYVLYGLTADEIRIVEETTRV